MTRPLRVMMMGLRGFPDVQGGVETHAEHLAPRLVALGCDVEVVTRSSYQPHQIQEWRGVRLTRAWAPRSRSFEAIIHSFLCVLYAAYKRPDVLHIHAIGPAIVTPLARLAGLKVVVTHHGADYDRQKWGRAARLILHTGERFGMRMAHQRIVISRVIQALVRDKHDRSSWLIPNGVVMPARLHGTTVLHELGLNARRYVLLVSRLVPEKRHLDLIEAFRRAAPAGWQLVIVGGSDHPDAYEAQLRAAAAAVSGVVMTGFRRGQELAELYAHAGLFVLPSSHEGLPIALLEAMSYGLPILASDIPANLEVGLDEGRYFPVADVSALALRLTDLCHVDGGVQQDYANLMHRYDWTTIARDTRDCYLAASSEQAARLNRDRALP